MAVYAVITLEKTRNAAELEDYKKSLQPVQPSPHGLRSRRRHLISRFKLIRYFPETNQLATAVGLGS